MSEEPTVTVHVLVRALEEILRYLRRTLPKRRDLLDPLEEALRRFTTGLSPDEKSMSVEMRGASIGDIGCRLRG